MTYLVTGAAGYIGGCFKLHLERKGIDAIYIDNYSTSNASQFGSQLIQDIDISDPVRMGELFKQHKIYGVFHFAANSIVSESLKCPARYWNNNVINLKNLLDCAIQNGVESFVFSSTAAVYGEPTTMPITENTCINPINTYGRTKLAAELLLRDYSNRYGLKVTVLRYFNAAGADIRLEHGELHDPETHLIPNAIRTALSNLPIRIFGKDYPTDDGTCVRDYVHVSDLAHAHLLAMEQINSGSLYEVYNLGTGSGYSVLEILKNIEEQIGSKVDYIVADRRVGDPPFLIADASKANVELEWIPQYGLKEIIQSAVQWELKSGRGAHDAK